MKKTFDVKTKSAIALTIMSLLFSSSAAAQEESKRGSDWYVGAGTGYNYSTMRFSKLDEKKFPTKEGMSSPIYSVFVQGEFGANRNYVVRPQLSFVSRGGKLKEIGKYDGYAGKTNDVFYKLRATYLDLRIPVLYQFMDAGSAFRPYAGITATMGFALSGKARLQEDYNDNSYSGYQVDLSSKNFSSTYFALAPTVGMRFNFHTGRKGQNVIFAAVEASYEIGLSDTYGGDEKDGILIDAVRNRLAKPSGTRKFSGFNMQVMVGIPFSAFKRCKETPAPAPKPAPVIVPVKREEPPVVKRVEEKPCYTLDEIEAMIAKHESVYGKTICAVDMINFDFGKSTIQPVSYGYLDKVAQILERTNSKVVVKGHTDNVGTDDFNMDLSKKRAKAVVSYLVKKGVDKKRLEYEYYGSSRPLKTNDTDEGRTYNRRVEFELQK